MAANAQIDLEQYLGKDEMKGLAKQAWLNILQDGLRTEADAERILTNDAYHIVGKLVEEKHHIDLERVLTERVGKLVSDEDAIRYVLTYDNREYGGSRVGIVLSTLERIVQTKFQEKLERNQIAMVEARMMVKAFLTKCFALSQRWIMRDLNCGQ